MIPSYVFSNTYTPTQAQEAQIEKTFTYHPPKADQPLKYEEIRKNAKEMAQLFVALCPPSRELSLALTHLEEAMMFANAAIARNE